MFLLLLRKFKTKITQISLATFKLIQIVYFFIQLQFKKLKDKFVKKKSSDYKKLEHNISFINAFTNQVYPSLSKILEETFSVIYNTEIVVLKNSGIIKLNPEDEEFKRIVLEFLDQMRLTCGQNVYNALVELWSDEDTFIAYIVTWLYNRIAIELTVRMEKEINQLIK